MSGFPVLYPPLEKQHDISSVLSAYDNLIENNQKQIKLLEEATKRLYKEWFGDLRFPGYEDTPIEDGVPEGWQLVPIGSIIEYEIGGWGEDSPIEKCDSPADVICGTDIFGLTYGNFSDILYRYHAEKNLKARALVDRDIIFEVSGESKIEGVPRTVRIRQSILDIFKGSVMCASFYKLTRTDRKELSQYLYDTLQYLRNSGKTTEFDKCSASSIVNYHWKDFLSQQEILLPSPSALKQYNVLAESFYNMIATCSKQNETVKGIRNSLLPKWMSGE